MVVAPVLTPVLAAIGGLDLTGPTTGPAAAFLPIERFGPYPGQCSVSGSVLGDLFGECLWIVQHDVVAGIGDGHDTHSGGLQLRSSGRRLRQRPDQERPRNPQVHQQLPGAVLRRRLRFLAQPASFFWDGDRPLRAADFDDPFRRGLFTIATATTRTELRWLRDTLADLEAPDAPDAPGTPKPAAGDVTT
ncbi:hypothetical protein AB0M44_40350 [Streptosporangium subroseum]|uniref:hypothetical protein n=1 Tax=Streptosporangium subroseum TaxID=106412 RepID=UPI00342DDADF